MAEGALPAVSEQDGEGGLIMFQIKAKRKWWLKSLYRLLSPNPAFPLFWETFLILSLLLKSCSPAWEVLGWQQGIKHYGIGLRGLRKWCPSLNRTCHGRASGAVMSLRNVWFQERAQMLLESDSNITDLCHLPRCESESVWSMGGASKVCSIPFSLNFSKDYGRWEREHTKWQSPNSSDLQLAHLFDGIFSLYLF